MGFIHRNQLKLSLFLSEGVNTSVVLKLEKPGARPSPSYLLQFVQTHEHGHRPRVEL